MAVTTAPQAVTMDYPAKFRGYIVRSAQNILARVQQLEGLLPATERNQALHTLSYALKLPEAWPDTQTLLLTMAPKMEQAGYRDEWLPYLAQGIRQSQVLDDLEAEAELHFQVGRIYRLRAKYAEARLEFETSLAGFDRLNSAFNRARVMNRLAQVARLERRFDEATCLAEAALGLLDKQDAECGYSYLVLGMVAVDKREWPEGVDHLERSLKMWERENNQRMMGRCLMSLGTALLSMKKYKESSEACQKAIASFEKVNDSVYQAIAQMNLGNAYFWLDRPDEAVKLHLQAERIFRRVQDRYYLALVNHNLGMAHRKLQQWEKAEDAYLLSIEHREKIGDVARLVNTMDGLGLVYLRQGQPQKAITIFEKALGRLAEIEGEPSYEKYLEMLKNHLQEAFDKPPHELG